MTLWAYAYEIVPQQPESRLGAIRTLLADEHGEAKHGARKWGGRVVCEQQATHILIICDTPDQDRVVNRRLEGQLRELNAGISRTPPMAVPDD
jgi:hypothetical protein